MPEKIKVLFLAAEAAPLVKVGGLGEVAGALPQALRSLSEKPDVRLVIPKHNRLVLGRRTAKLVAEFKIKYLRGEINTKGYQTTLNNTPVYLIDGEPFSKAAQVYSSDDQADGFKYAYFSLAALELAKQLDWIPDVLHAHDWHTALAVYALRTTLKDDRFFTGTRTLLTIHNLPYLGTGAGPAIKEFGIPVAEGSALPWWAQDMPLPMGLLTADKINTVSEGYAAEILTELYGSGLEEFLNSRQKHLSGILNGIDLKSWDPATDKALESNYSVDNFAPRKENKPTLLKELGLPSRPKTPLLAFIGRMDRQKGIEIALEALQQIQDLDWQAVFLGTGDPEIEHRTRTLAAELPGRVCAAIRFDGDLSRRIHAGADIMLIPSRYEPCGLVQMSAMRYGCVPLARATGGLRDTIVDLSANKAGTGFLFEHENPAAMVAALKRALAAYADRRRWPHLQMRGMKQDFSWTRSAQKYLDLYRSL
ncbi:MAG: glycogen synthase [Anaerolineales bacterium]|nr:glycogen synthase [Anaerolineales bacterium]